MKIAIVGDVHGAPLARKVDEIKDETNFDKLVVLGDLDRAHLAHELMDILDTEDTIAVVGNHDYSHINGETIYSGTMRKQSINSPQMWKEWANDPEATNFIRTGFERGYFGNSGILGKRVSTDLTPEQKIIVIHGAYAGDQHSSSGNSPAVQMLWNRLSNSADHAANFAVMASKRNRQGYQVMIRGHDHEPAYTYKDPAKGIVSYVPFVDSNSFRLFKHRQHTINPGALFDNNFAVIDAEPVGEDQPVVTYHKL